MPKAPSCKARRTASRSIREFSCRRCWRCRMPARISARPCCGRNRKRSTRLPEFIKNGVVDFGPARVERRGKSAVVTVKNPRFLNAEDDDTLDDTETATDIAILDPHERHLRAARRRGRASEICRPQDFFRRHQSHPSLSRQDSLSLVHPPRHGRRQQDAARRRHGRRHARRSLRRHARKAVGRRPRRLRHRRRLPVSAGDGLRRRRQRRLHDAAGAQGGHHPRRRQFAAARVLSAPASRGRPSWSGGGSIATRRKAA